jgi:hypothetical protein
MTAHPARVTAFTGEIVPKDVAADRMLGSIAAKHRPTLSLARCAYLGEVVDDWRPLGDAAREFADAATSEIRRLLARRAS